MTVNPQEIGVGEIADVRVHIERINPAGVLVILRYPSSYLNYLTDSSYLEVDG